MMLEIAEHHRARAVNGGGSKALMRVWHWRWLLAGSGKLLWRGGYWLALGAALAGATIRLHGSLEYSTVE